jgi:hypothetical protein
MKLKINQNFTKKKPRTKIRNKKNKNVSGNTYKSKGRRDKIEVKKVLSSISCVVMYHMCWPKKKKHHDTFNDREKTGF